MDFYETWPKFPSIINAPKRLKRFLDISKTSSLRPSHVTTIGKYTIREG